MIYLIHDGDPLSNSELIVKLMADRLESRIKLFVDLIPFCIFRCQLRVRPVGLAWFIDAFESILLVTIETDSNARQDGSTKRRGLFHFRHVDRQTGDVSLVLHPERIARGPSDYDETIRIDSQTILEGRHNIVNLIIESFNDRPQHIAALDKIAQPNEPAQRTRIDHRTASSRHV